MLCYACSRKGRGRYTNSRCLESLTSGLVVSPLGTPLFMDLVPVLINYYRAYAQLWYHNRHVAAFWEMDRLGVLDDKSQVLDKILHDAIDITSIHKHIKSLKQFAKQSSKKVLRVNRGDGTPSSSKYEEKIVFRNHLARQLGGTPSTFERAHSNSLDSLRDLSSTASGIGAACVVPGISALAKLFRSASLGAGGEDRIRGKLCRRFPRAFACLYYPLVFKTSCLLSPPLQWRGGVLQELFKNRGSSSSPDNYRDVMLGAVPGKCFTSHIRSFLVPVAKVLCGDSQFGSGLNGGETAFPHLYVSIFFDHCKHYKLSCANIFMDIVTAFAVLLRRILFDEFDSDETWLRKLAAAGFFSRRCQGCSGCC